MTIKDYYVALKCFFNWMVEDGAISVSPLARIPKPRVQTENVQPFTPEQIQSLLRAATRTQQPLRDSAIVLFLYDTGVRASELCALLWGDIDLVSRHATVIGKGNKRRTVYFSRETGKALMRLMRHDPSPHEEQAGTPVFPSYERGNPGHALQRDALRSIIKRLGKAAQIQGMKVSPHVFRHSAAIQLLRNGCDIYSLMTLLGHSDLEICRTYLKLSQADLANQHQRFSPVDSLSRKPKR